MTSKKIDDSFVEERMKRFFTSLDDCFAKVISDDLLERLLRYHLKNEFHQYPNRSIINNAYAAGVAVFDLLLETQAGLSINGHHLAQQFSSCLNPENH